MNIILYGVITAIVCREHAFCEKSNDELQIDSQGNLIEEDSKSIIVSFKENKKALLVWFLGWLPRDQLKKFKEVDEGEEQE